MTIATRLVNFLSLFYNFSIISECELVNFEKSTFDYIPCFNFKNKVDAF